MHPGQHFIRAKIIRTSPNQIQPLIFFNIVFLRSIFFHFASWNSAYAFSLTSPSVFCWITMYKCNYPNFHDINCYGQSYIDWVYSCTFLHMNKTTWPVLSENFISMAIIDWKVTAYFKSSSMRVRSTYLILKETKKAQRNKIKQVRFIASSVKQCTWVMQHYLVTSFPLAW